MYEVDAEGFRCTIHSTHVKFGQACPHCQAARGQPTHGKCSECKEHGLYDSRLNACPKCTYEAVVQSVGFGQAVATAAHEKPPSAWDTQVGGSHYKSRGIQPMQYSMANNLNPLEATVIKYVTRRKGDKAKREEDLRKAIHTLEMLIEWEHKDGKI